MKINITTIHFIELMKRGYDINIIFLLRMIQEGNDISGLLKVSERIVALQSSLLRKGLVIESGDKLTTLGQELLAYMDTKQPEKLAKRKDANIEFTEWWKEFPATSMFSYKGKTFSGDRSMRIKRDDCIAKFDKILLEGEYSAQQLIEALKYEVIQKKESSLKEGSNKLKYMHNSLTYLIQRDFEGFVEVINQGIKIKEEPIILQGTDI